MLADVVVVGAGMAGLTCALDLRESGAEVVVLEATDRAGGRVRTVEFDDGLWVESGGEWIDTAHANVHELLGRYGLKAVGDAEPWWDREAGWIDDERGFRPAAERWLGDAKIRADFEAYDRALTEIANGIVDPSHPHLHPDATSIDARSGADLLDELDLGAFARFMLTRAIEFEYTCRPDEISVLFLAQQRSVELAEQTAIGPVRSQRVDGGLSQLPLAMADDLEDAMRYGEPLTALVREGNEVVAVTPAGEVRAARAVLACALPPLRNVAIEPAFDGAFAEGVATLGYGAVTKTFFRYPLRLPFPWAVTHRFLQRVYDAAEDQPGPASVVEAYIGGDVARDLDDRYPDDDERGIAVREELERMLPPLAGRSSGGASRSWTTDPHFLGSFSVYGPGQVVPFWPALREPHGRVHLAGEHVATVTGYVEGAVESGHRVATRLSEG